MSVPLWVLLGFAGWTLLVLIGGIGWERWSKVLTGQAGPADFPADQPHGSPRYRRILRAHANCIENLPVYGAVAVVAELTGTTSPLIDALAVAFLVGRVLQTTVHIAFEQTNRVVSLRFTFFSVQLTAVLVMGTIVVLTV
jgi:uncharacterized MAPEG superfamily protein